MKRRQIHQSYRNFFKNYPFVGFQEAPDPRYESNRWLTCITIDSEQMDQICPQRNHDRFGGRSHRNQTVVETDALTARFQRL